MAELLISAMEMTIFNITLTCTCVLAFNLFAMESIGGLNFEILMAFMNSFFMLTLTLAYFYLSERVTTDLMAIGDVFYNSSWFNRLKAKQQMLVVLVLQRAQREVRLTGLGLFDCSMPIFSAVRNDICFFCYFFK